MSHKQMMFDTNKLIITKLHTLGASVDPVKKAKLRQELAALENLFGLHRQSYITEFSPPAQDDVLNQKVKILTYIPLKPKPIQFIIPVLLKFYEDMALLYRKAINIPEDFEVNSASSELQGASNQITAFLAKIDADIDFDSIQLIYITLIEIKLRCETIIDHPEILAEEKVAATAVLAAKQASSNRRIAAALNYQPAAVNSANVHHEEKKSASAAEAIQPIKRNIRSTQPAHLAVNPEQARLEEKLFRLLREMLYSHNAFDFFESQVLTFAKGGTQLDKRRHPSVPRYYNGGTDCVPAKQFLPAYTAKIIDVLKPEFMSDTPGDPNEPWRFKLLAVSETVNDALNLRHLVIFKPIERSALMEQFYQVLHGVLSTLDNLTEDALENVKEGLQAISTAFDSPALMNVNHASYFRQPFGQDR